jgi:hypothetical protein
MGSLAVDRLHRHEERAAGTFVGEVDGDHHGDTDADACECQRELPRMASEVAGAGAIEDGNSDSR